MLKELKLSNFRLFDDEVVVRFRPITVLIGKNNSGKSSVIYFLRLLQKSLSSSGQFLDFESMNETNSDLGTLWDVRNKGTEKRCLKFSLTVGTGTSVPELHEFAAKQSQQRGKEIDYRKLRYTTEAEVIYNRENRYVGESQRVQIEDGDHILRRLEWPINENTSFLLQDSANEDHTQSKSPLVSCASLISLDLRKIRHISAKRDGLGSFFNASMRGALHYVGQNGEYTLQKLYDSIRGDKKKMAFLRKHAKKILGIGGIRFSSHGNIIQCMVTNVETKAKVNIAYYGFGVNQCMPYFIQGLLSAPNDHIMIEQPEVHVHPNAQMDLGTLIYDLWETRRVRTIVETHSANILLRLRRLVSAGKLRKEDISIAYFSVEDGKPTVRNLDVGERGVFSPDIPSDFFDGDMQEVLDMNLGR